MPCMSMEEGCEGDFVIILKVKASLFSEEVFVDRVVFWNDANGSTFYLVPVGGDLLESHDLVIEDCTVREKQI